MNRQTGRRRSEAGFSLIEVLVAVMLISGLIVVAAATTISGARALRAGGDDTDYWAALSHQAESLLLDGYTGVTSGSATVGGFPMNWTVSGSAPKTVTLVATRNDPTIGTVQDTVLLLLVEP